MTDPDVDLDDALADLHAHLEATQERPVEREASRWIGEAEAVAADLAAADLPADVVRERVGHVRRLLGEVGTTDDAVADEHVAAARALADEILDRAESDAS